MTFYFSRRAVLCLISFMHGVVFSRLRLRRRCCLLAATVAHGCRRVDPEIKKIS